MRPLLSTVARAGCALAIGGTAAFAAPTAPEVEVTTVRFANVRVPANLSSSGGGAGTWLEADIALTVRPAPGTVGQMVSRVRVALLVGFELPGGAGGESVRPAPGSEPVRPAQVPGPVAGRRLEHYRAEAECVALEAGRTNVRFYLPPEIVKRDQLHGDPRYWGVEITAAGKALPPGRAAYATSLASAEQRKAFQTRATAAAAANDGILQPQYLTPFAHEYPRATPTFVRHDPR